MVCLESKEYAGFFGKTLSEKSFAARKGSKPVTCHRNQELGLNYSIKSTIPAKDFGQRRVRKYTVRNLKCPEFLQYNMKLFKVLPWVTRSHVFKASIHEIA